ncbi:MAG: hypothetical protein CM15mP4_1160 [Candidatus Neomarinimicrobiota bacterium]|nr:MAG: hypothetical protein CM15mP4_1160 [Candidatus Neomarinimicrobiota bacterium]
MCVNYNSKELPFNVLGFIKLTLFVLDYDGNCIHLKPYFKDTARRICTYVKSYFYCKLSRNL